MIKIWQNPRELKKTNMSSKELIATWDSSREALVEVRKEKIHKGKKNSGKLEKKTQETAEKNSENGMNIP